MHGSVYTVHRYVDFLYNAMQLCIRYSSGRPNLTSKVEDWGSTINLNKNSAAMQTIESDRCCVRTINNVNCKSTPNSDVWHSAGEPPCQGVDTDVTDS